MVSRKPFKMEPQVPIDFCCLMFIPIPVFPDYPKISVKVRTIASQTCYFFERPCILNELKIPLWVLGCHRAEVLAEHRFCVPVENRKVWVNDKMWIFRCKAVVLFAGNLLYLSDQFLD